MQDYWRKQPADSPLFPELLWSRPERRSNAGKLLVIGGNLHAFAAPAEAFAEAEKAGAGRVRVVLPDAAKKLVGPILEHVEYAPSTPSGSFAEMALMTLLGDAVWSDGVLLGGDLGRNAETGILLEKFVQKYSDQLTLTKDAVDYAINIPQLVTNRPETLLVLSFAQLQKLAAGLQFTKPFTFNMDLLHLVETLHEFTQSMPCAIMVKHLDHIHCAVQGRIISTPHKGDVWRVKAAAHAAVWWLQNPGRPLEAFAASLAEV